MIIRKLISLFIVLVLILFTIVPTTTTAKAISNTPEIIGITPNTTAVSGSVSSITAAINFVPIITTAIGLFPQENVVIKIPSVIKKGPGVTNIIIFTLLIFVLLLVRKKIPTLICFTARGYQRTGVTNIFLPNF